MPQGRGTYGSKRGRPKEQRVKLGDGKAFTVKEGAFRKDLGMADDAGNIPMGIINKINRAKVGEELSFRDKKIKVTKLLKQRSNLAKTFKSFKK